MLVASVYFNFAEGASSQQPISLPPNLYPPNIYIPLGLLGILPNSVGIRTNPGSTAKGLRFVS